MLRPPRPAEHRAEFEALRRALRVAGDRARSLAAAAAPTAPVAATTPTAARSDDGAWDGGVLQDTPPRWASLGPAAGAISVHSVAGLLLRAELSPGATPPPTQ